MSANRLSALLVITGAAAVATVSGSASAQSSMPDRDRGSTASSTTSNAALPPAPSAERQRRNPDLFAAGLVIAIAGAVVKDAVGGYLLLSEISLTGQRDETKVDAGYACLIGGALMIAVGIPMAIVAGKKERPHAFVVPMLGPDHAGAGMSLWF